MKEQYNHNDKVVIVALRIRSAFCDPRRISTSSWISSCERPPNRRIVLSACALTIPWQRDSACSGVLGLVERKSARVDVD